MNPIVAMIVSHLLWGAGVPIFKYSLVDVPPYIFAFLRFVIPCFIFLPFVIKYPFHKLTLNQWVSIGVGALFGIVINIVTLLLGLEKAPSINASIIGATGPIFFFLLSIFLLREKAQGKVLIGILLSLIGTLSIIFSPLLFEGQSLGTSGELMGNLFFTISMISAGFGPIFWKHALEKVPTLIVTFLSFVISSMVTFPLFLSDLQQWSFSDFTLTGLIGVAYGVIFSSSICYFLYAYSLPRIRMQEIGIFNYLIPVSSVAVAIPLLHEYPQFYFYIGVIFIIAGIFISEGKIHKHRLHNMAIKRK